MTDRRASSDIYAFRDQAATTQDTPERDHERMQPTYSIRDARRPPQLAPTVGLTTDTLLALERNTVKRLGAQPVD